jgi:hypothetical protein
VKDVAKRKLKRKRRGFIADGIVAENGNRNDIRAVFLKQAAEVNEHPFRKRRLHVALIFNMDDDQPVFPFSFCFD